MHKTKLEDMNLLENFLFESVLSYPEIGEQFGRKLLQIIFGRQFGRLRVFPQKVYPGSDSGLHGARLDVYIEEEDFDALTANGILQTVYNLEPERNSKKEVVRALPKRMRFYHAKIDAKSLRAGKSYDQLKNVIIVMIMPFDPFGRNRMVYTIRNRCVEDPDMPYDDGAVTIFLYTKGIYGIVSEELRQLLKYMEHTTKENASSTALQEMHRMVELVRQSEEVELNYMSMYEEFRMARLEAETETRQENILELLQELGEISSELDARIREEECIPILKKWLKIAAKVTSLQEFECQIS
ncbi:MAG: hypothetical protein J6A08_09195 [Lachnospiraceae bacterium]|nr:hypothetical protein [Lachnospiraceae bacterium]